MTLKFKHNGHLSPALLNGETRSLNSDKLTGRWLNTNPDTKGIAELVIEKDGNRFTVSVLGVATDGVISWPKCRASALANLEEEAGQRTIALSATFDVSSMSAEAYLRVNKGVLVTVLFTTFQDESGRRNYVNREFFFREDRLQ
jgi:hypothetical protein